MQKPYTTKKPAMTEVAWRQYYASLSDTGKQKLWQDHYARLRNTDRLLEVPKQPPPPSIGYKPTRISRMIVSQISPESSGFFSFRNQLRSMAFGLACGAVVLAVFSFVLFNEMVVSPFIRPSQSAAQLPVVNRVGAPVDPAPKIRIPKIHVEIPLVNDLKTAEPKQFELALDQGVVHYPDTALPGQAGNAAYFGHSSNNIFNPGKYKFAFVLLHELAEGDEFYLTHEGRLYTYQVISKRVVKPTEVSVLAAVPGQVATATLITCDPPGTSTNRLVVVGKQISPDLTGIGSQVAVDGDPASEAAQQLPEPPSLSSLPGNGPGLLNRIYRSVFGD